MTNSTKSMTRTMATAGIAGRKSLSRITLSTEVEVLGKWTTATQYPKEEQITSGTLFHHASNVTEANRIAEEQDRVC